MSRQSWDLVKRLREELNAIQIIESDTTITLTTKQMFGQLIRMNEAGGVSLPAVTGANGWNILILATGEDTIHADPDPNDFLTLDGTALDDGDRATSSGTTGDSLLMINDTVDGWNCFSGKNSWTDGG